MPAPNAIIIDALAETHLALSQVLPSSLYDSFHAIYAAVAADPTNGAHWQDLYVRARCINTLVGEHNAPARRASAALERICRAADAALRVLRP